MQKQPSPYEFNCHTADYESELGKKNKVNETDIVVVNPDINYRLSKEWNNKLYAASQEQAKKQLEQIFFIKPEVLKQESESSRLLVLALYFIKCRSRLNYKDQSRRLFISDR